MTIFNVSSASELNDALSKANGGDEIRLAGGDYGELELGASAQFSSEVTITSADADDPASFSWLRVNDSSNITFDSVVFDYTFNGENSGYAPFIVKNSTDITFSKVLFDGDIGEYDVGTGRALRIQDSSGITLTDSEVREFWKGIGATRSSDLVITNNEIHDMRSDGMIFGLVDNILIEGNYLHDWARAPVSDHADMIQFMKNPANGDAASNITIRGNVFDMGEGDNTQTLFMGNDGANESDQSMFYENLLIEDNIIYNAHAHGITVGSTDGLVIRNNTVIAVEYGEPAGVRTPKINVTETSTDVLIAQNVTSNISGYSGQSSWTVKDNVLINKDDPSDPGYYADMFVYYATADKDGYNQYGVKPGSTIDNLNAGSSLVDLYPAPYESILSGDGTAGPVDLGTNNNTDSDSDPVDLGTDGNADSDSDTVDPGTDETPDTGSGDKVMEGAEGTDGLNAAAGFLDAFDDYVLNIAAGLDDNDQIKRTKGEAHVEFDGANYGIVFDGDKDAVNLGRLREFENSEKVAFTVEFARDEADGSEQRVVWNHKKLGLTLDDDGLIVNVGGDDFRVDDIGLNDTDAHRISILVDQDTDHLQVIVDNMLVLDETKSDLEFVGNGGREWGWQLGTPWSRDVDGVVTDFRVDDDVAFVDDIGLLSGDPLLG